MSLTHISLFTGIGGIDLAAEAAGFETIAQVERDNYCRRVLARHWPDVPRFDDVRAVTADALRDAGIGRPTLLSGGFPCQPFSCAGKRRGREDDRYLWPEMRRILSELRPPWVLGENVAGFVGMALEDCAADLERLDYAVRAFVVPAAGVGAPHQRARCFIVANADRGRGGGDRIGDLAPGQRAAEEAALARPPADADSGRAGRQRGTERHGVSSHPERVQRGVHPDRRSSASVGGWWETEPGVVPVVYGIPPEVDRMTALGNSVAPAQVYPFVQAIADIERGVIA